MFTKHAVGVPLVEGIIAGMESMQGKLNDSLDAIGAKLQTATKAQIPGLVTAFKDWASNAKTAFDNGMSELTKKLDGQLKGAEAQIAAWKATLTPAEIQLNAQKAIEQVKSLTGAVNDAWNALKDLPAQQEKAMEDLIAAQQANMAALKATAQDMNDTSLLAGNTFQKSAAAAASDPLATALVAAQQAFNATKTLHDQGLASDAQFIAVADALDAAKLAASQDTNATTLLDQYNTYQDALAQQAAAGAAVTTQAQDAAAQLALQQQQATDSTAAWQTYYDALQANGDQFLTEQADASRKARNAEAAAPNTSLENRFGRIKEHLDAVQKTTDSHYKVLEQMASSTGKTITDNLAQAMDDATNPNQPLTASLKKVAALIAKYLKTNSPSELGPLSTLDHWMDGFASSYLKGFDKKLIRDTVGNVISPSIMAGVTGAYASDKTVAAGLAGVGTQHNQFNFNHTPANADPVAIGAVTSYAFTTSLGRTASSSSNRRTRSARRSGQYRPRCRSSYRSRRTSGWQHREHIPDGLNRGPLIGGARGNDRGCRAGCLLRDLRLERPDLSGQGRDLATEGAVRRRQVRDLRIERRELALQRRDLTGESRDRGAIGHDRCLLLRDRRVRRPELLLQRRDLRSLRGGWGTRGMKTTRVTWGACRRRSASRCLPRRATR